MRVLVGLAAIAWLALCLSAGEARPAVSDGVLPPLPKVLDRYIEALGGRAALERVQTRYVKGEAEMSLMPGAPSTWELITKAPNKRLSILTVPNFGVVTEGFDGLTAWVKNGDAAVTERVGEEFAKSRRDAVFNRELQMLKVYPDLVLKGLDKVGPESVYVAETKSAADSVERFAFGVKTGFLLRQESEFGPESARVKATVLFEEYRKVDKLVLPHLLRIRMNGPAGETEVTLRFKEVKHNVAVEDSRFTRPKE